MLIVGAIALIVGVWFIVNSCARYLIVIDA